MLIVSVPVGAADFGFTVIIQAGRDNNGAGANSWELSIGDRLLTGPRVVANLSPYYGNNVPERFEIGYVQSTNTAYVNFYHQAGGVTTRTFNPIGGAPLVAGERWTLPGISASATSRPNVNVGTSADQLALTTGMTVLNGLSSNTLTAFAPSGINGTTVTSTLAPVLFVSQGGNGDWMLSGRISFLGLAAYNAGGSQTTGSIFSLTASASSIPEPGTAGLMATAGGVLWLLRRRRQMA